MFLLDRPYVSDFLVDTLKEYRFPVVSTKTARELVKEKSLEWISEEEAKKRLSEDPGQRIYSNSENALPWLNGTRGIQALSNQLDLCKDKVRFRELAASFNPTFHFRTIGFDAIPELEFSDVGFPFVLKPAVGFFSLGVYIIRSETDLIQAKEELRPENLSSIFPREVLDTTRFIVEQYIEGEEYAIDCYFNDSGKVVILDILHHLFSSGVDTSDRVYTTSKQLVQELISPVSHFISDLGKRAGFRNFPAHIELRITPGGEIVPIEINPLRFGGFCTTADLMGVALNYNVYAHYYRQQKPDWDKIFRGRDNKKYSIVILNNNSGIPAEEVKSFNYKLLSSEFENTVEVRKIDISKLPLFGFLFLETTLGNEAELHRILTSDLTDYIDRKSD